MAKSKDDIKYATSQARLNDDEAVRVLYKHGTPLEGGKIADSEPVDLFSGARNISKGGAATHPADSTGQAQQHRDPESGGGAATINSSTGNMSKKTHHT
jgi:hypothetical protein